jgi:hypothetical protein
METMATKDKKSQIRINPDLAKALATIAKAENVPGYVLIEKIAINWIKVNKPELLIMLESVITEIERRPSLQTRLESESQTEDRDDSHRI